MRKINGFCYIENPDWQHDNWQFQQLGREIKIFKKMEKDRKWVAEIAKDRQEIAAALENIDNIQCALCEIELHKQAIYYYKVAESMYDGKASYFSIMDKNGEGKNNG